ncbi:MAG: prolipoprotein diacylglyceryl transferase [Deltaproteobacteria bacterium]|jgi:phosphatidylglycerol:prolipoprotein diacylglycerol transferase|nr:prolipoprotein diacylglyceryl transferase [Deltaproteobacteria bacterium]
MFFPWYALMYPLSFVAIWFLARRAPVRVSQEISLQPAELDVVIVWAMVGAMVGGRLGYVVLYEPGHYLKNPLEIFQLWRGGMSFHGGLLGVLAVARLTSGAQAFWPVMDRLALWVPLGLCLGRLGNFFSGELWGLPSDLPWAMVFDEAGPETRHPSQLYEACLEGPLLMAGLRLYARRSPGPGKTAALMAVGYGFLRIAVEFFREPDPAWGYLAFGWLTLGQVLSLGLAGVGLKIFLTRP